jgi:hypothetical protein
MGNAKARLATTGKIVEAKEENAFVTLMEELKANETLSKKFVDHLSNLIQRAMEQAYQRGIETGKKISRRKPKVEK